MAFLIRVFLLLALLYQSVFSLDEIISVHTERYTKFKVNSCDPVIQECADRIMSFIRAHAETYGKILDINERADEADILKKVSFLKILVGNSLFQETDFFTTYGISPDNKTVLKSAETKKNEALTDEQRFYLHLWQIDKIIRSALVQRKSKMEKWADFKDDTLKFKIATVEAINEIVVSEFLSSYFFPAFYQTLEEYGLLAIVEIVST